MSNAKDFIIENGVLTKYVGPGGDVIIPEGVTMIGISAFSGCNSLRSITIPNSVTMIEVAAFYGCSSLQSITIHGSATTIGDRAFSNCRNLQLVAIPVGRIVIANTIFQYCESLESIVAPKSPFSIFKRANIAVPALVGYWSNSSAYTDQLINKEYHKYMFSQRKRLLPEIFKRDLVVGIAVYADAGKITVKNVDEEFLMPAQQAGASQCVAYLMEWKNKNISPKAIENYFEQELMKDPFNAADMKKIWSYIKLEDASLAITSYKGESDNIVIPERIGNARVTAIAIEAFRPLKSGRKKTQAEVLSNIVSVIISEGVTTIKTEAFSGCSSLQSITIPNSVTMIGAGAFYECCNLQFVTIPDSVTTIGGRVFYGCSSLQTITIPVSVTSIGREVFLRCDNLTIHAPAGSYAEQYAKENNIPFVAE